MVAINEAGLDFMLNWVTLLIPPKPLSKMTLKALEKTKEASGLPVKGLTPQYWLRPSDRPEGVGNRRRLGRQPFRT